LGTIVSLNNGASPSEKDRNEVKDYIIDNATGSHNAGGVMILFNNGKDTEPTVLHLNGNQLNERYLSLGEQVQDNILKGHSAISGELFGFTKDGNFNQSNIDIAYSLFKIHTLKCAKINYYLLSMQLQRLMELVRALSLLNTNYQKQKYKRLDLNLKMIK